MATGWITGPGLWPLLAAVGFFAAASLNYAIVSQHFPRDLTGRANTAHNVLVFITAFIVQWGIGGILGAWEDTATHQYDATGYQVAFSAVAFAQCLALIWFLREWWFQTNAALTSAAEPAHHSHRGEFEAPIAESPTRSAREENR